MFYIKEYILFGIFILLGTYCFAQDGLIGYWQPQISLNYKVSANYGHNFGLEKRNYLYRFGATEFKVRQIDISHFSKWKIEENKSIALGIKYRFRELFDDRNDELRFTQQFNITHQNGNIRFGHRFRSEQRITKGVVHRFRYRFATDFPLNGEKLDIGETYLVASTESLVSISKGNLPAYDHRITFAIGWMLSKSLKLQSGTEFRIEDYTHNREEVVFLLTSAVLNL